MIPTIDFYGTKVSRLILGDNVVKTLFEAEESGINTYMALADPFILRVIRQYRNEGGKMAVMFQSFPPVDLDTNIWQMMACEPIAIYHQGGTLDLMCEENKTDEIVRRLEKLKATGVKVGIGTHVPETVLRAESENWGADFYMTCLYNARRTQRGQQSGFITGKPKQLVFYPGDPVLMYDAIRAVPKPCIAFKIFAGGQVFSGKPVEDIPGIVENVFTDVYGNIKASDIACVGVFQKHTNQLKDDAAIANRVLGGIKR